MIEHLESRIAPAAVITFTEVDGDKIKITTSKGTKAELIAAFDSGIGDKATGIDATDLDLTTTADFAGANLAISVLKAGKTGDGLADNVTITGYSATLAEGHSNIFLNNVTVQGNLSAISVGDDSTLLAVNKLTVTSWGPTADSTGVAPEAVQSVIFGSMGKVVVKHDFNGYLTSGTDYTGVASDGSVTGTVIGSFTVGGTIASQLGDENGHIQVGQINKLSASQFFGPAGGSNTNNGVIEAVALFNLNIGYLDYGAQIIIADSAAIAG